VRPHLPFKKFCTVLSTWQMKFGRAGEYSQTPMDQWSTCGLWVFGGLGLGLHLGLSGGRWASGLCRNVYFRF